MTHCHECDSQVAENDIFCPFCGARLHDTSAEPAVASEPAEDLSANATTERDMIDLDVPEIPADLGRTSDNVVPQSTSDLSNDAEPQPEPEPEPQLEPEPILVSAEPEVVAEPVIEIFPEEPGEPTAEQPVVDVAGGLFDERPFDQERGISKPLDEFDPGEPPSPMYDSVRIMESKPRPDEADTRIQGISDPTPQPPAPAILSQETDSTPKSYTEPNMGVGGDTDGKRSAKLKPLTEGTILNNRYEVVRKIGGGGMGAVYLASDNNLGGVLRAVKEMVQSHIEEEQQEKAINDFKRESMILSTLDHPSIPTIYDYFYDSDEGRFYLVMKYISGGDLASRLRSAPEGKIDEKSVTQWALQITDVLDYLHNQPSTIVYRDLKPSNIMVDGNSGRIMLIDFGIARSISQKEEKGVTAVGTMGYAPPELFSGNVEPRSDIYSLGSTMFHLLTGADPQSNPLLI
ncbi:MAG TPA: protein kinase, partial [Pyrinomonadaceae bacterium]|nr:protein kinase [Pyrinomonadaceae bacterium]